MSQKHANDFGVRNAVMTTIRPDIPNYLRMPITGVAQSIEPYERRNYMTKHQEIIDHHVSEMERLFGGKMLKFNIDYDAEKASAEDLSETLFQQRAMDFIHRQIDPLTLALAKVERYEELIKELGQMGRASVTDWIAMSEGEEKIRHEIFSKTEMSTFGDPEHDIDFARRNGFTFNELKKD